MASATSSGGAGASPSLLIYPAPTCRRTAALPATARQPAVDHRQATPAPEGLIVDEEPGRAEDAAADRLLGTRLGRGVDLRIAPRLGGEAREFQHHAQVAHI